jgi:hypothetical protein
MRKIQGNSIGKGAIKIAFIQTLPGYELQVRSELEAACEEKLQGIKKYAILKGLGNFDIILVYLTEDFDSHLRLAGPIKNILKSNILLCYPYFKKDIKIIFDLLQKNLFTVFCMLKVSSSLQERYPQINDKLRKFINSSNVSLLGSLGWNELIIMLSSNEIEDICNYISENRTIIFKNPQGKPASPVISKSLSIIGINYEQLPSFRIVSQGFVKTKNYLQRNTFLKRTLRNSGALAIFPTIDITAKAIYQDEIRSFFTDHGFRVSCLVGKQDILVRPLLDMTWSDILSTILFFRHKYRDKIFSTNTRISFEEPLSDSLQVQEEHIATQPFDFDYQELIDIFGKASASNLSNVFYTVNSLLQNPLSGYIFTDMQNYPDYIMEAGRNIMEANGGTDSFATVSANVIRRGAEIRSYGTFETIEEVTGRFTEFRGGCQISILAIELLPTVILDNLNAVLKGAWKHRGWRGFIAVSPEPMFSHVNEVLNVTPEALWDPQTWWALYHEIAHIIIEKLQYLISKEKPSVKSYLSYRDDRFYDELIELCAELIGYELGFFGDYELYLQLLWKYLIGLEKFEDLQIEEYVYRSFFIELFTEQYGTKARLNKKEQKQFLDLDFLYGKFINHMHRIEGIINKAKKTRGDIFLDKSFVAAQNVKMFADLNAFCKDLSTYIKVLKLRPDRGLISSLNTQQIIKCLENGEIWNNTIESPQAVLYHILKNNNLAFNTRIATILSFRNQQLTKLRPDNE